MSDFGLSPHEQDLIRKAFERHPHLIEARIFGSRAIGRQRSNSDIDLALWGNLDTQEVIRLHAELDDLPLPYLFDVKLYDAIRHAPLRDHIQRVGRVFYQRLP